MSGLRGAGIGPCRASRCGIGPCRAWRCGTGRPASRCGPAGPGVQWSGRCSIRAPDAPQPRPCLCPRTGVRYRRLVAAARLRRVASAVLALARSRCSPRLSPPPCGEAHRGGSRGYSGRFVRRRSRPRAERPGRRLPRPARSARASVAAGRRAPVRRGWPSGPANAIGRGGRAVRRAPSAAVPRVPSVADGRAVRRGSIGGGRPRGPARAIGCGRTRRSRPLAAAGRGALARGPAPTSCRPAGRRRWRPRTTSGAVAGRAVAAGAPPSRGRRGRRPSGPGRSSRSRWSRSAAGSSAGSSMFRRQHEPSSGHCGHRRYDRRRLPLGPWAFRVPQPRQPTSSICHHRTQTNEEGRSTSSGATLFTYVRRRPTLPRGPPRSTIGAEGLNFRVRNGTGCFPFAITAETLLRCHRPAW